MGGTVAAAAAAEGEGGKKKREEERRGRGPEREREREEIEHSSLSLPQNSPSLSLKQKQKINALPHLARHRIRAGRVAVEHRRPVGRERHRLARQLVEVGVAPARREARREVAAGGGRLGPRRVEGRAGSVRQQLRVGAQGLAELVARRGGLLDGVGPLDAVGAVVGGDEGFGGREGERGDEREEGRREEAGHFLFFCCCCCCWSRARAKKKELVF